METDEFEQAVLEAQQRDPALFDLPTEEPMSLEEISAAESNLDIVLPDTFRWFLGRFGAGHFALTVIYSLLSGGVDSVADALELPWLKGQGFFPVADNGAGDYYGFVVCDQRTASSEVFLLDHETNSIRDGASFPDFLSFVASVGLGHIA